jgi:hypothetical protein
MFLNCDGAATTAICSIGQTVFTEKALACGLVFVDAAADPAQGSLKSDRGSPSPAKAAKKKPMRKSSEDQ